MSLRPTRPKGSTESAPAVRERREHADLLSNGGREHVDVVVPRTSIRGRMRVLSRAEVSRVKSETRAYFADEGMPGDPGALVAAGLGEEWNLELAARVCAYAVRDPKDESKQLASVDDWRDCDDDQIDELWQRYQDLRERLDPLGPGSTLTEEERASIEAAAKKGEVSLLMSYGSRRLSLYTLTLAGPPAS